MASLLEVVTCHSHCLQGVSKDGNKATKVGRSQPREVEGNASSANEHMDEKDKLIAELKRQLEKKNEEIDDMQQEDAKSEHSEAESEAESTSSCDEDAPMYAQKKAVVNAMFTTMHNSALAFALPLQIVIYLIAFGGVVFVLVAHSFPWGQPKHRRLQVNSIPRAPTLFDPDVRAIPPGTFIFEDFVIDESMWSNVADWQSSISDYFDSPWRRLEDDVGHSSSSGESGGHASASGESGDHDDSSGGHSSSSGESGGHSSGSGSESAGHDSSGDGHSSGSGSESAGHESTDEGHSSGSGSESAGHDGDEEKSSGEGHSSGSGSESAGHENTDDGDHGSSSGNHTAGDEGGHGSASGEHGDGHGDSGHQLIVNIAYCTVSAGLIALLINLLKQPLLLGYIIGGVVVGPIGLKLIESAQAVNTISEFGLILLLFMIGLELDVSELLKMGKVVILTGLLQFPICAVCHMVIFTVLSVIGISFGEGSYSVMYMAVCCGISSTMIVVKLLSEKMETDSAAGRLTVGVLIFQDMWAIVVMAIQPNLANIDPLEIMLTFVMMGALLAIAFAYSKYVLPAVFVAASESMELLLVLSLAWCFFVCCIALLPWFNLSMELAALIAGVAMATFPYSAELNGKVKYIRDFFITLYFVSLGMQIPPIAIAPILKALLVCVIVLLVRWIGLYLVIGGISTNLSDNRLAVVATMNLSEVSEFGLVLCSIGKGLGHVETDTFTIMIWVFSILAVGASYFIKFNNAAYLAFSRAVAKCMGKKRAEAEEEGSHAHDGHVRDIVLLGYSRTAKALVSECYDRSPALTKRLHVVCQHGQAKKMAEIKKKSVSASFADIGVPDVLEEALPHGEHDIQLIIITQTDDELKCYTNLDLMNTLRKGLHRCKNAKWICTATSGSSDLYADGASYVVKPAKLQAERLGDMLIGYASNVGDDSFVKDAKSELAFQKMLEERAETDGKGRRSIVEDDDENEGVAAFRSKKAKGNG